MFERMSFSSARLASSPSLRVKRPLSPHRLLERFSSLSVLVAGCTDTGRGGSVALMQGMC